MKHKTMGLTGALLDAAVAMAEGLTPTIQPYRVDGGCGITIVRDEPVCVAGSRHFEPSCSWADGGPIIERERIASWNDGSRWHAGQDFDTWPSFEISHEHTGPTPLIAAMRAYVASKLGEEVELP
jgi:hypothetical protein